MFSTPMALRLPPHRTYAPIIIRCLYPSGIFHKRTTALFARFQTAPKHACVFGCGLKTAGLCAHCGRWSRGSRASPGAIRTHRHAGAEWVKELKRVSNEWIQKEGIADFQWQAGYAGFSISQSNLEQVSAYIMRQEEHHKKTSFQDELRALLRKHQMEWDEKYLWD